MLIGEQNVFFVFKGAFLQFVVKADLNHSKEHIEKELTDYMNRKKERETIAYQICDGWFSTLSDDENRLSEEVYRELNWHNFTWDVVPFYLQALKEIKQSDVVGEWDKEMIPDLEELKELDEEDSNFVSSGIEIIYIQDEDELEAEVE